MPNPDGEFDHWSRSLEIFLEHVPQTRILVTIVSGVIQQNIMQSPLTWLRKNRPDRQRLAFIYQFLRQTLSGKELFGLTPRVTFGEVVEGSDECACTGGGGRGCAADAGKTHGVVPCKGYRDLVPRIG